jgi:hypothetical protein
VEEYGVEEADLLLDRPPGGWGDLVTKEWLHLKLAARDGRLDRIEDRLTSIEAELRALTWKLIAAMTGLLGALVAAIKL